MRAAAAVAAVLAWASAAAAATPLQVTEVVAGVFVHQGRLEDFTVENAGGIANIGFVVGSRSVAVIDSGGSRVEGEELLEAIRSRTALPVSHVINTHAHPDHVLGNAAFRDGTTIVGHARLADRMAEAGPFYLASMRRLLGPAFAGTELLPPTVGVKDQLTIDLGGRLLELRAWPTAHTDTDLTVLDVASGTLFAGDLLFMDRLPVVDGSLLSWLGVMDQLETIPARRVVPGHGPTSAPWPEAMAPQRAYLAYLRDQVRDELRRNRTLEQAVEEVPPPPGQSWRLTADNHARNVTASFTELEWE